MKDGRLKTILSSPFFATLFWLLIWQLASMAVAKVLIFPGPVDVFKAFVNLATQGSFWISILMTLLRITLGYIIGVAAGCILSFVCCTSSILDSLLSPVIRIIRATPVASFIILAMLWMATGAVPVLMSALIVTPVIWGNLTEAYRSRNVKLFEMAKAYRLGRKKTFRYVLVPSMMGSLKAACITSLGFAWKAGIAAEVLSQPKRAIGSNIFFSKVYLETPELFAWTAAVIILSFLLELLVKRLLEKEVAHEN